MTSIPAISALAAAAWHSTPEAVMVIAAAQAFGAGQNPYPAGTALRQWWEGGYQDECDELCPR